MARFHPDVDSADRYRMGGRNLLVLDVAQQRWFGGARMTSFSAHRLNAAHDQVTAMMRRPDRADDLRLYQLSNRIRVEGLLLLSTSALDLDFLAFLSKEKAAGRTYSSEALAKQVFSQAGVVAPPESLNSEISPVLGKGSKNGL